MQTRTWLIAGAVLIGAGFASAGCDTEPKKESDKGEAAIQVARQTADPRDGTGGGTTGGSNAAADRVVTVTSRAALVKALGGDNATNGKDETPKVVMIGGDIDLRADDQGTSLPCEKFAAENFSYDDYLKEFDPKTYGRKDAPEGPLEDAREASVEKQEAHTEINVGSNTTIFGLNGAQLRGGTLNLKGVTNVIVRNVAISGSADCFPLWDATDGDDGSFNPDFDNISISKSSKIWIDHNALSDGPADIERPERFGVPFDTHDGLLDITDGSTDVTVSYNDFANHNRALLIGSDDKKVTDRGKLAVTVHHNRFAVGQRAPRVRFGEVDVFNNLYLTDTKDYDYLLGVGLESRIHFENNFVVTKDDQPLDEAIDNLKGTRLSEKGTMVQRGATAPAEISLRTVHNDANDEKITEEAGFEPDRRVKVDPAADVLQIVQKEVGPGRIAIP